MRLFDFAVVTCACALALGCEDLGDEGAAGSTGGPGSGSGSSSSSSSSTGGQCAPEVACGSGFTSVCGVQADTCGGLGTCECPGIMECVHAERCCQRPAWWGYETQADQKCAAYPGYSEAYVCGELPLLDPASVDAGSPKPWLDADGVPTGPLGPIPDYCVRANYLNQPTVYVLWCCTPNPSP